MRIPSVKPPPSTSDPQLEFQVTKAARECIAGTGGFIKDQEKLAQTLSDLVELAEQFAEDVKGHDPPVSPTACRAGCSYCCYYRVHVTPLEILSLAQHIRTHLSDLEFAALVRRLADTDRITHDMSDEQRSRAQIPCPLLVDNHCLAYDARPLECRGYVSMDAEACRRSLADYDAWDVPLYFPQYSVFKNVQAGIGTAAIEAGRPFEILELTAVLRIVLEDPTAIPRWVAGGNSFQAAALSPCDPEYLAFKPWTPTL